MRLWTRGGPPTAAVPATPPTEPEPAAPSVDDILGILACSARGCTQVTGIACAYTDPRDRRCPTAWCPQHRSVLGDHAYCPVHARTMGDTEHLVPDLDNPVPMLVSWVARELEPDLLAIVERIADEHGEVLVADPVRFVLVGIDRVRTWERAWKMCSHTGMSLRVHVAVEEASPDLVLAKVGSRVIAAVPAPSPEIRELAEDPTVPRLSQVETFRSAVVAAVAGAVSAWRATHPPTAGAETRPAAPPRVPAPAAAPVDLLGRPAR